MSNKLLVVDVKGTRSRWMLYFYGDPKHIPEWQADGLEVKEILNDIPMWVVDMNLVTAYCFMQDVWNLKNPFKPKTGLRVINTRPEA